jgi:hypothetical protein
MTSTMVRGNVALDPGAVAAMVLGGNREPEKALAILSGAERVVRDTSRLHALFGRVTAVLVTFESALDLIHPDGGMNGFVRNMITAAAQGCEELAPALLAADPDSAYVLASLRTECLYLLHGGAERSPARLAAAQAQAKFDSLEGPSRWAKERHKYDEELRATGHAPITSSAFVNELILALQP